VRGTLLSLVGERPGSTLHFDGRVTLSARNDVSPIGFRSLARAEHRIGWTSPTRADTRPAGYLRQFKTSSKLLDFLVARDGIERNYIGLQLPLTGLQLDRRLDLAVARAGGAELAATCPFVADPSNLLRICLDSRDRI
jgi:hypothetical protein